MEDLPKELFTSKEVREYFKISRSTLDTWLASGVPRINLGRQNRYDIPAIVEWLDEQNKKEEK